MREGSCRSTPYVKTSLTCSPFLVSGLRTGGRPDQKIVGVPFGNHHFHRVKNERAPDAVSADLLPLVSDVSGFMIAKQLAHVVT